MNEQRVTRNVLNLLSSAAGLARILDYPVIDGRIRIAFNTAAELIRNVQIAASIVSDDAIESASEVDFIKSELHEL